METETELMAPEAINAAAAKAPRNIKQLCATSAVQQRLEEVLGKRAPQFASSLITLTQNNKLLAEADPSSVLSSAMIAATLDLPISQNFGFAWIVPYKGKAQFQMGYKGFIQLAQRSGQFKTLNDLVIPCGVLKSYDPITEELDLDWDVKKEGQPDGYVVHFELMNGFKKTVFWPYEKVEAHAKRFSQAYRSKYDTPWKSDFDAMALKTVIKYALGRYAPLSVEMQRAMDSDQATISATGEVEGYPDNKPEIKALDEPIDPFLTEVMSDEDSK